ncbi:MAG TPA: tetratricopeptide repeat protein [Acidimicrobiales bacterium]|nr:tetratricopeptide repeat protein [Acidimicrobiales bacterium]
MGPVDHHIGSLYRVLGRYEEAEGHLRRALALEAQIGARPFLARTSGELTRVLSVTAPADSAELHSVATTEARTLAALGIVTEVTATPDRP